MRFIRTRVHGVVDYVYGIFLTISPWVFGFATGPEGSPETVVAVLIGAGTIIYSLFTDYETGMYNLISVRTHLWLDLALGAFLASSPWLLNFADRVWIPHFVFGSTAMLVSLLTTTKRASDQSRRQHHAAIMDPK